MNDPKIRRPTGWFPRPREFLRSARDLSENIRRHLQRIGAAHGSAGTSASADDAKALATLITQLCDVGVKASAADAIVIAEKVDQLVDQLRSEIDFILTSRTHRAQRQ